VIGRRELSCRELVELVTDYFEDALGRRDRRRFERHIAECEHCTAYLEQMRETITLTGRLTEERLDPHARDELLAAFRTWHAAHE
jgi:anti-sigma factor RsiW